MKSFFRTLEPTFFSGLLDDPVLWIRVRPWGRSLLVDCGQLHHLAKRVLRSVSTVFVSHAHMDHFMGIDTFVRQVHVAPRTVAIYGPPGLAARLEHKLAGYDWNLAEEHWCTLQVHEVHADRIDGYAFPGPRGFRREDLESRSRQDRTIFGNRYLRVEAELCDHKLPVLALRITESPGFGIDPARLAAAGLEPGPWLRRLKRLYFREGLAGQQIEVPGRDRGTEKSCWHEAEALYHQIRTEGSPPSIGYVTDVGFTAANRRRLRSLLEGVELLVCECSFLAADADKARDSWHLCTTDLNRLLAELRPAAVLPMHLSKAYLKRTAALYAELDPPPGTQVLRLPDHVVPRPLLPQEIDSPGSR